MDARKSAFLAFMAERLRSQARPLAGRWLETLSARRPEPEERIFPTKALLNSVPELLAALADALETERSDVFETFAEVETRELAALRAEQGYGADELVEELELLSSIVFDDLVAEASRWPGPASPELVMECAHVVAQQLGTLARFTTRAVRDLGGHDRATRESLMAEFTRVLNHELRNRLGTALINAQLLRDATLGEEESAFLDRLESALSGLENLVSDAGILVLSEFERPDWSEIQRRSLRTITSTVVAELSPLAEGAGVAIRAPEPLPAVQVNRGRGKLILANLVGNAIKYADPDKSERWVEIRGGVDEAQRKWWLEVEDNGVGIPKSLQDAVFHERVRADSVADQEGQGLGLALVRDAVHQLGGEIGLTSQVGTGTRFSLGCPLPREDRGQGAAPLQR